MKVEIPESVQAVLRCSECDELLSCGPVYLVHGTNEAICGRCSHQPPEKKEASASTSKNRNRSRNIHYEAAAKLLSFPCRYSLQGCPEKIDFSENTPNNHERDCEFRTFFCPIESRDSCGVVVSSQKLRDHCQDKHPTHLFPNPFVLPRPDLSKSNLSNFLVSAFNILFLLHIKVCLTSGKIFHSLRMFGDSGLLDKFWYTLEISENDSKITKKGSVLPPGTMVLEGPTANWILINNFLGILDGKYDGSEFTITIQTSVRNCVKCSKNIEVVADSVFCGECQGKSTLSDTSQTRRRHRMQMPPIEIRYPGIQPNFGRRTTNWASGRNIVSSNTSSTPVPRYRQNSPGYRMDSDWE